MIASQLRGEVARLLQQEVVDPRVRLVTVTRVDVAPDLSNAIVYYSVMGEDDPDSVEAVDDGLYSAAPFLRRKAAHSLSLRRMPELRFRYDPSLALGSQTLAVLRETQASDSEDEGQSEDDGAQT
jgi:ribosome-binding factor A